LVPSTALSVLPATCAERLIKHRRHVLPGGTAMVATLSAQNVLQAVTVLHVQQNRLRVSLVRHLKKDPHIARCAQQVMNAQKWMGLLACAPMAHSAAWLTLTARHAKLDINARRVMLRLAKRVQEDG
jgi:hypothetical protein